MIALAGCLVVASLLAAPSVAGLLGGALALLALGIAIVDWRRFVIPDEFNGAAAALGLINAALVNSWDVSGGVVSSLLRGASAAAFFWGLRLAYLRLRRREGIGLGDVKLAGVAGLWLDWPMIPVAVEIAALAALGGYVLEQRARSRALRAAAALPFGVFFAPSIWLCWLAGAIADRLAG